MRAFILSDGVTVNMLVYWAVLLLFTTLGLGIPYILIWKLVVEEVRLALYRKKAGHKPGKKRAVHKTKFSDRALGVVVAMALFALSAFALWAVFPYWQDVPRAVTGHYAVAQGRLDSSEKIQHTGRRSWGYSYSISVGGVQYSSMTSGGSFIGDMVTIRFLPHTKVILNIKRSDLA